jgi:hypothetical protein
MESWVINFHKRICTPNNSTHQVPTLRFQRPIAFRWEKGGMLIYVEITRVILSMPNYLSKVLERSIWPSKRKYSRTWEVLKLSVNDILYTRRADGIINNLHNTDADWNSRLDTRAATIAFSYRFGKSTSNKPKHTSIWIRK